MSEITLLGYGNQGRAWAKNLRDSGWKVKISGRDPKAGGQSQIAAAADGFATESASKLPAGTGPVAMLLPDERIPETYRAIMQKPGRGPRTFVFAHGFSVVYGNMEFLPEDDVILVAPKGIGVKLRELYTRNSGVMGVIAVQQDGSGKAWETARAIAKGLGCYRVEVIESTFADETNADLLSEQVILCGALPRLLDLCASYLVKQGVDPRMASYECLNEMKLIVDMMVERGVGGMLRDVSNTAKYGGLRAAERLFPDSRMQPLLAELWQEITTGKFANDYFAEVKADFPFTAKQMQAYDNHFIDGIVEEKKP